MNKIITTALLGLMVFQAEAWASTDANTTSINNDASKIFYAIEQTDSITSLTLADTISPSSTKYVKPRYMPHYSIGVLTGIDLGGAVPWPVRKGIGKEDKLNAKVNIAPAAGIFYHQYFNYCWSLRVEATYKTYGIDATARVYNQKYNDPVSHEPIYFQGTTNMKMSFSMFEFPVMFGYSFGRGRTNTVMAGLYYSQFTDATFMASPKKGLTASVTPGTTNTPNWENADLVTPGDLDPQIFDQYIDNHDYGFILSYSRCLFDRVGLGARFAMGLKDVFRADGKCFDYEMLSMRGSIVIDYKILGN